MFVFSALKHYYIDFNWMFAEVYGYKIVEMLSILLTLLVATNCKPQHHQQ